MRLNLTLSRKAFILVSVPLVFQLAFVSTLGCFLYQMEGELKNERHAKEVVNHLNKILRIIIQLGGLSMQVRQARMTNGNHDYSQLRRQLVQTVQDETSQVQELVEGRGHEEESFNKIKALLSKSVEVIEKAREVGSTGDTLGQLRLFAGLQRSLPSLCNQLDVLIDEMNVVQEQTYRYEDELRSQMEWLIAISFIFNIVLAVVLAWFFQLRMTRPLNVLMDNTYRLISDKELTPPVKDGDNDEIAALDKNFRAMAEMLAEAIRKQRAAFENAVDVICSIDEDGRFANVNPASTVVWGYTPEDLIGTRISQLVYQDDIANTLEKIKHITAEQGHGAFENRIIKIDKTLVDMDWTAQWSQKEKALYCVAHNITERKQIDRLKQDFVAMVSHDLRTPLTSVQGFLELLGAEVYGPLSEAGYDSLEITEDNIARLITLINDLLDLEKMESGMLELHIDKTDLANILKRSTQAVAGFANHEGIKIVVADDTKLMLDADNDRMVQVVVNLLSNAIKFSPKGETITIDAEHPDKFVRVNIKDRGRGVPEHMRESIFERFKQVELSDERKKGGSGLGLAICKAIVERHGGGIGVEPGDGGVGSTFWFTLPVSTAKPTETKEHVSAPESGR